MITLFRIILGLVAAFAFIAAFETLGRAFETDPMAAYTEPEQVCTIRTEDKVTTERCQDATASALGGVVAAVIGGAAMITAAVLREPQPRQPVAPPPAMTGPHPQQPQWQQPNGPQTGGPQTGGPQTGGPQTGGPQSGGPQPSGPQPSGPQLGGPAPWQPR